jgi:anti-anti-sigma regulatory factor
MITQRDLATIGPANPPRGRLHEVGGAGSAGISIATTLTISGSCRRPVLDELRCRSSALLAAGARDLVVDLSDVTDADHRLLRALVHLQRGVENHCGRLTLIGASGALVAALETATLAQAFLIYRSVRPPPPESIPASDDPEPDEFVPESDDPTC